MAFVGALAVLGQATVLADAQTLDEASQAALDSSLSLKADRARQDGAEERLRGSIDSFMPTVSAVIDRPLDSAITYSPQAFPTSLGLDTVPRAAPRQNILQATLPLFDGFRRWNTYQSSQALVEAGRNLTISRRQQVMLDTGSAYLAVARDNRIVALRQAQIAAVERIRAATAAQFAVNDATQTDVALTQSRVQEAQAAFERASADLAASRLEFKRLTKVEPERLKPPRLPDRLPKTENAYAELVRRNNPSLAASRADVESAGYLAQAAKAELLPQLDFQFSDASQYGYSPALKRINDTTSRLLLRVPIYEPGAFPRIGEAAALARQRDFEAQDTELSTVTAARTSFVRRQGIANQLTRLRGRVADLRKAMEGYEIERGAGFRTVLDELNIRAELADAEVALAIVAAEHDGLTLTLAAAASLLAVGHGREPQTLALENPLEASAKPARQRLGLGLRGSRAPDVAIAALDDAPLGPPVLRGSQTPVSTRR